MSSDGERIEQIKGRWSVWNGCGTWRWVEWPGMGIEESMDQYLLRLDLPWLLDRLTEAEKRLAEVERQCRERIESHGLRGGFADRILDVVSGIVKIPVDESEKPVMKEQAADKGSKEWTRVHYLTGVTPNDCWDAVVMTLHFDGAATLIKTSTLIPGELVTVVNVPADPKKTEPFTWHWPSDPPHRFGCSR